ARTHERARVKGRALTPAVELASRLQLLVAADHIERGDQDDRHAQHTGQVLRERDDITRLEDVVEEREGHAQEADDDREGERLLHPSPPWAERAARPSIRRYASRQRD